MSGKQNYYLPNLTAREHFRRAIPYLVRRTHLQARLIAYSRYIHFMRSKREI